EFARLIAGRGYERDVSQSLVSQIETGRLRCSADLALFLAQQFPTELGKLGLSALDLRRAAPAKRRRRRGVDGGGAAACVRGAGLPPAPGAGRLTPAGPRTPVASGA